MRALAGRKILSVLATLELPIHSIQEKILGRDTAPNRRQPGEQYPSRSYSIGRNSSKATKIEPTETLSIGTLTTKTIDPKFKVPHTTRFPTNSTE
ncbi:unnamed protein product [Brassica rapa subsp. trilocularis]